MLSHPGNGRDYPKVYNEAFEASWKIEKVRVDIELAFEA